MQIQKVIHVHIQSQQKRVEFSGIDHCFFLNYEEWVLSYLCRNGPSLKYRLYVFYSVDNFIKFSTHNQLTQSLKKY